MNEPAVTIRFDGNGEQYPAGGTLAGDYRLRGMDPGNVKVVEVSVLWYTEGKGDEDMAVHAFWRTSAEAGDPTGVKQSGRFETPLPKAPLSYDGAILKLRWCVRVRVFLFGGKEVIGQRSFQLGSVPAVEPAVL